MCWNIRGHNHPSKHIEVRNVLLSIKVNMCVILQNKVSINDVSSVCSSVMNSWNFIRNGTANINIRVLLLWNPVIWNVKFLFSSYEMSSLDLKVGTVVESFGWILQILSIRMVMDAIGYPIPFKFFNYLNTLPGFRDILTRSWNEVNGSALYILATKLKRLKMALEEWKGNYVIASC